MRTKQSGAQLPEIEYDEGVHLEGSILWFDPPHRKDLAFVSYAGATALRMHRKVLCTPETLELASRNRRKGQARPSALLCPYERPFSLGPMRITLHPMGYIPGAAQLEIEWRGSRILYSGAPCLRPVPYAEPARAVHADVLVLATALARPGLKSPPLAEAQEALRGLIEDVRARGKVPVLLADVLGTAQEVQQWLAGHYERVRVHRSIHLANVAFGKLAGLEFTASRFRGDLSRADVVVWPTHLATGDGLALLEGIERIALTGLAALPDATGTLCAEHAVAWTRHPDLVTLLDFAARVAPKRILTIGRFEAEAALAFREAGYDAQSLRAGKQLRLGV